MYWGGSDRNRNIFQNEVFEELAANTQRLIFSRQRLPAFKRICILLGIPEKKETIVLMPVTY